MLKKSVVFLLLVFWGIAAVSAALAFEEPCIGEPYGWQYQDDTRSIVINKVSDQDITYYVADVQLAEAADFHTAVGDSLAPVSTMAAQANAVLAINGDDYGTHKYGVIIRNGKLLRTHDTTRNLLILDKDGNMTVKVDRQNEDYKSLGTELINAGVWQTFEFGPELVRDGQAVTFSDAFDVISTRPTRLEPRTAVGQIGPLHYLLIVVDGRQDGYSSGISLQGLQQLFLQYGATTAMNLDGGGSAEMWFNGDIINSPSGGEERYVSDIIYF
ncbi:MAG: phosphodiester glycosidase family protein [Eubacteriales bacterium]|nr:phosphodiester glycosidase family protein [Eubacteriales bacterium]